MRGHNFGGVSCRKCGKIHIHPKGMLGKSNKGIHLGVSTWNKGLTTETDERVSKYGKSVSKSFIDRIDDIKRYKEVGASALRKYIKDHPEHQSEAARIAHEKHPELTWSPAFKIHGHLHRSKMEAQFCLELQKIYGKENIRTNVTMGSIEVDFVILENLVPTKVIEFHPLRGNETKEEYFHHRQEQFKQNKIDLLVEVYP